MGTWGGARKGAGRKPKPSSKPVNVPATRVKPAETKVPAAVPAEPKASGGIDARAWAMMLPEIEEISRRYAVNKTRSQMTELNPFQFPKFPDAALPKDKKLHMAQDGALAQNMDFGSAGWLAEDAIGGLSGEGLMFLGYTYLSELAQRPEYRVMSETIADDATRKWIDFDVVGDEKQQLEDRQKDPEGYDERLADPDERKKRVEASGKTDRVKQLEEDQLRLEVKLRYYEQARNGGFFGRTHLFHDIRTKDTDEVDPAELVADIGDGLSELSKTKCPVGAFKGLRTIEPVWTYPLMYNAINPLRKDWYNPQVWFVMGQEIHGSRLATFIPHPVPDMLKPAYAFGGLSLSQMAKPYVDRWLTTVTSVNQLIHSFSVMVLMTDLSTILAPGNAGALMMRVAMFNMLRDNQGAFVVNKNTEDFKNVSASLAGLHELQAQSQEHIASINRIPLVKYTGIQPAGLNASSEGEIEVYDDTIGAYQSRVLDPNLRRTLRFEMLSLWGEVDKEITHRWQELRPMTQSERGQKEKDDADRDQKYVDMGAIAPAEVRKRIINDKDLPYTGLNPDDVPPPPAEEGLLGPGAGGAAKVEAESAEGVKDPDKGGGASDAVVPFAADAWTEADHPRGQPGNAGQFGPGGGGGSKEPPAAGAAEDPGKKGGGRKYGGLYKSTGQGARADHRATVAYALKSGPRTGSSYRELVARLIKDTPEHGDEGDADKLKAILARSYLEAADQLRAKAQAQPDSAAKFDAMAKKAVARAEALGLKQEILPPDRGWTGEHDASPELRSFRDSTRADLVKRGVAEGLEDMTLWDLKANKPISMKATNRGARNVQFTPEMLAAFRDPGNSIELHHNHPSDTSFSSQDLDALAYYPGMSRVYAHGHGGSTYVVDGAEKIEGGIGRISEHAGGGEGGADSGIGALPLAAADKSRIYQHVVMTGLAKAGLIHGYRAHLAPDLEGFVKRLEDTGDLERWTNHAAARAGAEAKRMRS